MRMLLLTASCVASCCVIVASAFGMFLSLRASACIGWFARSSGSSGLFACFDLQFGKQHSFGDNVAAKCWTCCLQFELRCKLCCFVFHCQCILCVSVFADSALGGLHAAEIWHLQMN